LGKADETQKLILELAKYEFLEKGFKDASVRNIAKTGNITTGAIYRYFPNNESLFSALVEPAATKLYDLYAGTQQGFVESATPQERSDIIDSDSDENILKLLELIYDNWDVFNLIICCSEGTKYAEYIDKLSNVAIKNTYGFIHALSQDGIEVAAVSDYAIHTICRNTIVAIFEVVVQQIPKKDAVGYIKEVFNFYNVGWKTLLNI
jgi:AcrR family transcriptional regulator